MYSYATLCRTEPVHGVGGLYPSAAASGPSASNEFSGAAAEWNDASVRKSKESPEKGDDNNGGGTTTTAGVKLSREISKGKALDVGL